MARQVRDARLETREARARLKARKKPYWRLLVEGRHLGYYKGAQGGRWLVRVYQGSGKYLEQTLALADDHLEADDEQILSYAQAHTKAAALGGNEDQPATPYTVRQACEDYFSWFAAQRKSVGRTRQVIEAHILPTFGDKLVAELSTMDIRRWHSTRAETPARLRSGRLRPRNHRAENDPRARKSTANRILTVLKAALNHAFHDGKIASDEAWRKVKPFRCVDAPTIRYLSIEESTRLVNACTPDFRPMVQAALLSGCRYGELVRAVVRDYNHDAGCFTVQESKSGKPRHVPLTDEGRRFFERLTAGRLAGETLFLRQDGKPWGDCHQQRPLARACEVAKICPAISFHVLRHTYGSLLAMRGVPLQVIAEALGHADTRITSRHYAHLMPSYVSDTIRANLPVFGIEPDNVVRFRQPA